jgi:membrane-bound serine protease (ClpP class)
MNPMNRYERVLGIVANPVVVAILLLVGIAGILVEFISPGLLVPGTVGVLSLLLSFMGAGALLPSEAALALLLLGGILVAVEFFIPGGVLGVVGAAALLMALGIWMGQASTAVSAGRAALIAIVVLLLIGTGAALWMRRYFSTTSESGSRQT